MSRLRVLIATTEGPSEVQQIVEEEDGVRSVICLDGTSEALPVSADYDSFVRKPTGVIERLYGRAAYRTDVSQRISAGRSWQLGLLVAHDLFAAGRLATKGTGADEILWVTGEVRHNLDIVAVDHVCEKLRESAAALRAAVTAGTRVVLVVPSDNRAELDRGLTELGLRDAVQVEAVSHWHGARPSRPARAKRWLLAAGAAAAAVVAVVAARTWMTADPAAGLAGIPEPPRVERGDVGMSLTRAEPAPASAQPPPAPIAAPPTPAPRIPAPTASRPAPAPIPPPAVASAPAPSLPTSPVAPPARPMPSVAAAPSPRISLVAVEFRPPAGQTCGGQRLLGGGLTETVVDREASGDFPRRNARDLCDVEFRVRNTASTAQRVWLHVQATAEGTRPRQSDATLDPGKELTLRLGASPWQAGAPWNAEVLVALDPKTAPRGGSTQQLTDALRAAHVTYETVSYVADAPMAGRYR